MFKLLIAYNIDRLGITKGKQLTDEAKITETNLAKIFKVHFENIVENHIFKPSTLIGTR